MYEGGLRGKEATSVTAGLRWNFTTAPLSNEFLKFVRDHQCVMQSKHWKSRGLKEKGPTPPVTLPVCESIILWVGISWQD